MRSQGRHPTRMALPVEPICDEPDSREDLLAPDEVLYSGSDDEYYENPAERRHRYEAQARRFLAGKPVLILSASLTGPFTKECGWQNPWRSATVARESRRPGMGQAADQRTSARMDPRPILDDDGQLDDSREERGDTIVPTPKSRDVSRRRDGGGLTLPLSAHFPSAVRANASFTPVGPYIDDTARARIRSWRDKVQPMAVPREEFWTSTPPQADQGTPTRKKRAAGSEWLRRTISKRIKLEMPDTCASPSPALFAKSLPSSPSTSSRPSSSTPNYNLPSTSHAGYARRNQRSSSPPKAVVGQRLRHRLPNDYPIRDVDAADMPQGRPYDFHAIGIRRHQRIRGDAQGGYPPGAAVCKPPSAYDIIDTTREEENDNYRSNPSVNSSLQIQVDESFEYRRKPRQDDGAEVAYAKPTISKLSTGTKASPDPRTAKRRVDQNTETNCSRSIKNESFVPPSDIPGVALEFSEAPGTIRDDELAPDIVHSDGLDEGDTALEDDTSDAESVIDGPTLVPSSTSAEAEAQEEKASSVSADYLIPRRDTRLASGDSRDARGPISDVSQLAETRENLAEIANPRVALAPDGPVLRQGDIPNPHRENDNDESSLSDDTSVILPLSQEAWGLGVQQVCEPESFIQQETQNPANAISYVDVRASSKDRRSTLRSRGSGTREPGGTIDHSEIEPEIADETIVVGFDEPHSPAQETLGVLCPDGPKRTPTLRRGYAPMLQQSPWVEEVVNMPSIPSLATQAGLLTAEPSKVSSNATQALPSVSQQTLGSSIQLPALQCFKPFSSPVSSDSPLRTSNHTLPEPGMEPRRDVNLTDSQTQAHPPSTPETKHSSLPTPDFTLSIKSFKEFLTPSPVRTRRPKRVSIQNGQLPSTQILYDAALSNPWKTTRRSNRRVKFAPLPGEVVCDPSGKDDLVGSEYEGAGLAARDDTELTSRPRSGGASPPLNISQTELPAENTRFGKHFAAMTRKGPQALRPRRVQRLLPSVSQQACASPGFDAMAEAFIEADQQVTTHKGESGLETRSVYAVGEKEEEPDSVDDVRAVLENLDEFLDSFDVDIELERARADDLGATTEGPGQLANIVDHMTSFTEVNVWE